MIAEIGIRLRVQMFSVRAFENPYRKRMWNAS